MTRAPTRLAWLQKHPTPAACDGEFHWYPATGDRELRGGLVERLAGVTGDAVLWQLAPGQAAWAQTFAATAHDGRRYTGLALAIVDGDAPPAELLARLVPPPAAPWAGHDAPAPPAAATAVALPDPARVARALLVGGAASVGDLAHPGLPRAIAAIERCVPADVAARARRGSWLPGAGRPAPDAVAELCAAAASSPRSRSARAWQLMSELATRGRTVDDVAAELAREPAVSTAEWRRGVVDWVTTLNAWGRGRIAHDVDALADRVALRVLGSLLADRDPQRPIAEVRWHALLPAARRAELLAAVARRAATLRGLVHA
ncbi:MAG TPA: hypothetical protein VLX92_25825 [Kofleriaceae bacterium]|nr:hypothetical protein [Kofleriaceae bacterium]